VNCSTQEEIDYYWDKLSKGGNPKAEASWNAQPPEGA